MSGIQDGWYQCVHNRCQPGNLNDVQYSACCVCSNDGDLSYILVDYTSII